MKFFLFFAAQNVLCEQTPSTITKPCVIFEKAPTLEDVRRVANEDFEYPSLTQCRHWVADADAGVFKIQCSNPKDQSFRDFVESLNNNTTQTQE